MASELRLRLALAASALTFAGSIAGFHLATADGAAPAPAGGGAAVAQAPAQAADPGEPVVLDRLCPDRRRGEV